MTSNDQFKHLDPSVPSYPTTIDTYWEVHDNKQEFLGYVMITNGGYIKDIEPCLPQWLLGQHLKTVGDCMDWMFSGPSMERMTANEMG